MQSQKKHPQLFSFEFYPPKTEEGTASLQIVHSKLAKLNPDFFFPLPLAPAVRLAIKLFQRLLIFNPKVSLPHRIYPALPQPKTIFARF